MQVMLLRADGMNNSEPGLPINNLDIRAFPCNPRSPNAEYTLLLPWSTNSGLREKVMVRMIGVWPVIARFPLSLLLALLFWP